METGHGGVQHVLSILRYRYWVIGGAATVKHYVLDCMQCRNRKALPGTQIMSPLPSVRIEPGQRTFHACGVDLFGPFFVKIGRSSAKRYGCIFTCLASRAVHLELVESLSTDAFLGAFFRFLCSRGFTVKHIFSDNGTNFVGAVTKLCRPNAKNMMNELRVLRNIASLGIEWHFNAPASSHAGGVWERLIRSVRKVLTALADDRHLFRTPSDYDLWTNFKHVKAILNNRPLTPVSADPDDMRALTPMGLLNGNIEPPLSPGSFAHPDGLRASWKASQLFADEFWRRWLREYVPFVLVPARNFRVGDLVLLVDDQSERIKWPKAMITEVLPDRENVVRRVRIRTASGQNLMRDVRKICLLEAVV